MLIKADEDFLSTTGSKLFGGVWVAMLFQACLARVSIPREDRLGFTLYIDEASNFFSEKLRQLLIKAREYKLGVVFAFQDMEMIESPQLRASILGSTSTKLAGGLNAHDRKMLAAEMNTTDAYLRTPRKVMKEMRTEFACYVRGVTDEPIVLSYPIAALDKAAHMDETAYAQLIEENRTRVSWAQEPADESDTSALPEDDNDPSDDDGARPTAEPVNEDRPNRNAVPAPEPLPVSSKAVPEPKSRTARKNGAKTKKVPSIEPKRAGPKEEGPSFDMDFTNAEPVKKPKE